MNHSSAKTKLHIALVRTGSPCKQDSDPQSAKEWLAGHYSLKADFHPRNQEWLSAKERADILLKFMLDDSYDVLWSFRGGEGTADILPYLKANAAKIKKAKPKLLMGFSDFTAFINFMNQRFSWPTVHGPGIMQLVKNQIDKPSRDAVMSLVYDRKAPIQITQLVALNDAAQKKKSVTALLCGGNMSLLAISIKDIWQVDAKNKILILEDVDERPHKISRYLNYFNRVGVFKGVKALILGDFIYHDNEEQKAVIRTLKRFAGSCTFPVLHTTAFGHGKVNMPLPFYRRAKLELGASPQLSI